MKVRYEIESLSPIFTGGDENSGTLRKLRRESRLLKNPIRVKSKFTSKIERTKALMDVIYPIYSDIDRKLKSDNYGFYAAYANKVKAAIATPSKKTFLNTLLESCGIPVMSSANGATVIQAMNKFEDVEFLEVLREEHQYLMILLREYVDYNKRDSGKIGGAMSLFGDESPTVEEIIFEKNFENVPYIGGNSIRGYLRRLAMYDYCKLAGVKKIEKDRYHQLFTGGNITESTAFEDISKREEFIRLCPPIGLLGSAIGNMTIEGELKVGGARLKCRENGSGDLSFWHFIGRDFGTRLDSSKREKDIEIVANTEEKSQMIYQYETFVTGSVFDSSFVVTTENELLLSAFWRIIELWKEQNYIGGNSARDSGHIDIKIDVPSGASDLYVNYVKSHSQEIKEYFNA